jgi:hypothetical protein
MFSSERGLTAYTWSTEVLTCPPARAGRHRRRRPGAVPVKANPGKYSGACSESGRQHMALAIRLNKHTRDAL